MNRWKCLFALSLLFLGPFSDLRAQGREQYLNFLAPPVKPITTVEVGGRSFLLVCNTPASRLEVWSPAGGALTFLDFVPTGLKPVSVAVKPTPADDGARIVYTANWLGDSITAVRLALDEGGALQVNLLRTVRANDEPMHIGFLPEYPDTHPFAALSGVGAPFHEHLVVVFGTPGLWGTFDPTTLLPSIAGGAAFDLKDALNPWAVKEPRVYAMVPADATENQPFRLVVLSERGGQTPDLPGGDRPHLDPTPFDFDLWMTDDPAASAGTGNGTSVSNLGTTNLNMAIAPNGDIYVVGQTARNLSVPVSFEPGGTAFGEAVHQTQVINETGFVTSMIWRIKNAGTASEVIEALDLNLDRLNPPQAVAFSNTVTQPTDVLIYGNGEEGTQIFVTGFASDNFGVINVGPTGTSLASWRLNPISINNPNPFLPQAQLNGRMKGPRAFAVLRNANPALDMLYIYNWLDNSVSFVPVSQVGLQPLTHQPLLEVRPNYLLDGQSFLFASALSGTNTVSCGSCHIDGESDWLAWNLSDGKDVCAAAGGDPQCVSTSPPAPGVQVENPGRKGPMVTQTLRGLVNFEVEGQLVQDNLTNAPYHWRGDRGDFTQFNGAFVNLMAIQPPFSVDLGVSPDDMVRYRDFIESVHHRPPPEQPIDRRVSGEFFSADNLSPAQQDAEADDFTIGTQAQLGLKLFYQKTYAAGGQVMCASCHILPAGSDTRITEGPGFSTGPNHPVAGDPIVRDQGIETAALRFLTVKEKRRFKYDLATEVLTLDGAVTANSGMIHTGADTFTIPRVPQFGPLIVPAPGFTPVPASDSIFAFNNAFFGGIFTNNNFPNDEVSAVTLFIRQFDTGVAPSVGLPFTVDPTLLLTQFSAVNAVIALQESFADEVNAALVALVDERGIGRRGYRYDPVAGVYVEVSVGLPTTGNLTRNGVLAFVSGAGTADNIVVFQNVPLGSEDRLADLNVTWASDLPVGPAPGAATLEGMIPNTAHRLIPLMDVFWPFVVLSSPGGPNWSTGFFQQALLVDAATATPPGFGLNRIQSDAPRRFRARADDVAFGAELRLTAANSTDLASAVPPNPPPLPPNPVGGSHIIIELNIHPGRDADGPYWETDVEFDMDLYYALMNGAASDVTALSVYANPALVPSNPFTFYTTGTLNPMGTNWYWVQIDNNGVLGPGSWQRITIQ